MTVCLDPAFSLVWMRQRGMVYDGATQPACRAASRGRGTLYFLLAGTLSASTGLEVAAPAVVALQEDVLEGALGRRPATLRIAGEPHESIALHVDPTCLVPLVPQGPMRDSALEASLDRAASLAEVLRTAREVHAVEDGVAGFVAHLQSVGVMRSLDDRSSARRGPLEKIFSALQLHFARVDAAPSLVTVADLAGISLRTADRLIKELTRTYGLPDEGLRDLALRWRLKLATLLLSNPDVTVRRAAARAGYRDAEALAHALCAAGLPPPSAYRTRRG